MKAFHWKWSLDPTLPRPVWMWHKDILKTTHWGANNTQQWRSVNRSAEHNLKNLKRWNKSWKETQLNVQIVSVKMGLLKKKDNLRVCGGSTPKIYNEQSCVICVFTLHTTFAILLNYKWQNKEEACERHGDSIHQLVCSSCTRLKKNLHTKTFHDSWLYFYPLLHVCIRKALFNKVNKIMRGKNTQILDSKCIKINVWRRWRGF